MGGSERPKTSLSRLASGALLFSADRGDMLNVGNSADEQFGYIQYGGFPEPFQQTIVLELPSGQVIAEHFDDGACFNTGEIAGQRRETQLTRGSKC